MMWAISLVILKLTLFMLSFVVVSIQWVMAAFALALLISIMIVSWFVHESADDFQHESRITVIGVAVMAIVLLSTMLSISFLGVSAGMHIAFMLIS